MNNVLNKDFCPFKHASLTLNNKITTHIRVAITFILTLKHTQSENGSVTMTKAHDMAVSSQPQRPTPLSDSSAEMKMNKIMFR